MKEWSTMKKVKISTDYITLGQLLKYLNLASSGGEVKHILANHHILINSEHDQRRGRKIYPGYTVEIESLGSYRIIDED